MLCNHKQSGINCILHTNARATHRQQTAVLLMMTDDMHQKGYNFLNLQLQQPRGK